MANQEEDIQRLILHVENVVGRKISSPRDFSFLARQLEDFTGERISISTLKRIWGYTQSRSGFSLHSLDVLARSAGYSCWDSFSNDKSEIPSSQFFVNQKVCSYALEVGEKLKLTWKPNRIIHIEYNGNNKFTVLESLNSKLQPGDIFHCEQFMESEPLIMTHLIREGMTPCDYICGKQGGIRWSFI